MRKKLSWRIKEYVIGIVCNWIEIGGHCGLRGKWEQDCLVPSYWRVTICKECIKKGEEVLHYDILEEVD